MFFYFQNILEFSGKQLEILLQVQADFEKILSSTTLEQNVELNEKHILQLGKASEIICTNFDQPTVLKIRLKSCLNTVFEKLYGINYDVPEECNYDL